MSAVPETLQLEFVTDTRNQRSVHHLDDNRTLHHSHPLESNRVEGYPVFTFAPHKQPNALFYCSYNEIKECRVENAKCSSQEDAGEEPHKRDSELPVKAAAEVAAAARFISKIDIVPIDTKSLPSSPTRPRLGSLTIVRDSIIDSPLKNPKSRPTTMPVPFITMSNRRKATRPPPLQLGQSIQISEDVQTPIPMRSSSKGAPSFDIARPLNSAALSPHSVVSLGLAQEVKSPLAILTAENASTFQFEFSFPTEPPLSRSASDATTESKSPQTPSTDAADEDLDPMQEQIRKDFEEFALGHGPYLRGSSRRMRRLPVFEIYDNMEESDALPALPSAVLLGSSSDQDETETTGCVVTSPAQEIEIPRELDTDVSTEREQKSSSSDWLQRKPEFEVDDLIDLYLTEEQKEEGKAVKQAASSSKVMDFQNQIIPDALPFTGG